MYKKFIIFLSLIFLSCSNNQAQKSKTVGKKSCLDRVNSLFKNDKPISEQSIISSINKIYNKILFENIVHIVVEYDYQGDTKNLEIKWDEKENSYQLILGMIKNSFEESLPEKFVKIEDVLNKLKKYTIIYKQSFYFLGHKKLFLTYDDQQLSSIYLGKDFSCRFENKIVECHCGKYFR